MNKLPRIPHDNTQRHKNIYIIPFVAKQTNVQTTALSIHLIFFFNLFFSVSTIFALARGDKHETRTAYNCSSPNIYAHYTWAKWKEFRSHANCIGRHDTYTQNIDIDNDTNVVIDKEVWSPQPICFPRNRCIRNDTRPPTHPIPTTNPNRKW